MNIDHVRELKSSLGNSIVEALNAPQSRVSSFALSALTMEEAEGVQPTMALGISPAKKGQFRLAIRCQRRELLDSPEVERIKKRAKNEVDVRYIGRVSPQAQPWEQKKHRPLKIGTSVGHIKITAGTLGCFVRKVGESKVYILSNNHVLANENRGKANDPIVQPGPLDDPANIAADSVASLIDWVKLSKVKTNFVDAAIALVESSVHADLATIKGLGKIKGLGPEFLDEGTKVAKLGRTTSLTKGKVTAFELDNVIVTYGLGNLRFDNQVEIEGEGKAAFSRGGDSGSLIVNAGNEAVALLFAGGTRGGTNDLGLTYANPIHPVFSALKLELTLS